MTFTVSLDHAKINKEAKEAAELERIEPICEAFKAMLFMQCQQTDRLVETAKRATTMLPRAAVEENRAAFEKRFGIDLYSVDNWLRENKLLVQPAGATPSESN